MKTFGKIIICIIVILLAVGTAYLIYNNQTRETNNISNTNSNTILNNENVDNEKLENDETSENNENTEYIGEEEQQEEIIENEETESNKNQDEQEELTGKDKAIDIVTKKYAMEGEIVKFDHMEGNSYVIKINAGTAVTWYLVDGTTWEAEEY